MKIIKINSDLQKILGWRAREVGGGGLSSYQGSVDVHNAISLSISFTPEGLVKSNTFNMLNRVDT